MNFYPFPRVAFSSQTSGRRAKCNGVDGVEVGGASPERRAARFIIGVAVRVRAVPLCHGTALSEQNVS